jgi:protein-tyrosine phosphatase
MGRVDLHNHILFGIDDGAVDLAESLALARELTAAGYSDVATTPHAKPPEMDPSDGVVSERLAALQAALDEQKIPLKLHPGRENHLTPQFVAAAEQGQTRPLGNGPYVLVELPFQTIVPGFRDILFKLMLHKIRPILAHPERCAQFVDRPDAAREAFDAGALFQIELGSLANIYGPPARKCAQTLLDDAMVAVAATDAHHLRATQLILANGFKALQKSIGATKLQLLTEENPGRVLRGEQLLPL